MQSRIETQLFAAIQKNDEKQVRTLLADMKKFNEELEKTDSLKEIIKPASIEIKDENGYTPLIQAAKEGYAGIMQVFLENGALVDNPGKNGSTPIMFAAQHGHKACINLLIEAKANLNAKGESDRTALMWAAYSGKFDSLEVLLEKKVELNNRDTDGYTALIIASKKEGCARIVQALLENGAEVDYPAKNGSTPIMFAAQNGNKDCVALLMNAKANINAQGVENTTALMWAVKGGNISCVQFLIENKAELNNKDTYGCTALILASKKGDLGSVAALLRADADITIKDNEELTAAQHALNKNNTMCHDMLTDTDYFKSPEKKLFAAVILNDIPLLKEAITQIKKMNDELKEHPSLADGMDYPIPSIDAKIRNNRPLISAAKLNRTECLKLLIDNKADLNINEDGTALIWAIYNKCYESAKLLSEADNVDLNAKDDRGKTALMRATEAGFGEGISALLEQKGIDVNAKNKNGDTALILAAYKGFESVIKTLLEQKGIDINAKDKYGTTSLIWAIYEGHKSCAKLLLTTEGIDLDVQESNSKKTALHYAAERGNTKLCELLIAHGANTKLKNRAGRTAEQSGCSEVIASAIKKQKALHPPLIVINSEPKTLPIQHHRIVDGRPETGWPRLNSILSFFNHNKPIKQPYTLLPTSDPSEQELSTSRISSQKNSRES